MTSNYLSKRGFVINKDSLSKDNLIKLKLELRAKPLIDDKYNFNKEDNSYAVYLETKTKIHIPKMFGIQKYGFPDTVSESYTGKKWDIPIEFNGTLLERQIEPVNKLLQACYEKGGGIMELATGFGKCMAFNTPILMFDGTIKKIQDIHVGELLMGDDNTSRTVLSLARGQDLMYDIIPKKGEKYTVNKEHILCLKVSGKPTIKKKLEKWHVKWFDNNKFNKKIFQQESNARIFFNTIKQQDIMEIAVKDYITLSKKIKHILKGYRVPIEFQEIHIDIDPYIFGIELGTRKTNFIPHPYKCNSRVNRLKLLAGLLDSGFQDTLTDDVIFLCKSLGFAFDKSIKNTFSISGNIDEIPTLMCNNNVKFNNVKQTDILNTHIIVKKVGINDYYGFEIDNNKRYLIGDFTVTHNTICALNVLSHLKGKTFVIVNKIPLMNQWKSEIQMFLPNARIGTIQGQKNINVIDCDIVICMLQSLSRIDYPDELFNDGNVVIFDEVHNISSKYFSQVLFKLCCKYTIGLSATPKRADGCEYVFKWHLGDIVYKSNEQRVGNPPIIKIIKIDTTEYKEIFSEKFGQKQIQFTSMLSELVEMPKRNLLIINLIKDLILKDDHRKILILSDRRSHLQYLKQLLDNDLSITFTYGLFVGSMKQKDLAQSRASQVILATFAAFSEGVSEKQLDTLILTSPKKYIGHLENKTIKNDSGKLEQIVGRIFRQNHTERNPIIIDLYDNFSVYKNQGNSRKVFYKQHFTNGIFENLSINLDDITNNNFIQSIKIKTTKEKKKVEINNDENNNMMKFCILD